MPYLPASAASRGGDKISRTRAGTLPGFQNACGMPRGLMTYDPGLAWTTSSPIFAPISPSRTYENSSANHDLLIPPR